VNLDGVGLDPSVLPRRFLWKFPRKIPYRSVSLRETAASNATSQEVRRPSKTSCEAFARRKKGMHTLPESFIYSARRHPFRFAMADGQRPKLSWFAR